jgi:hypothetical protein
MFKRFLFIAPVLILLISCSGGEKKPHDAVARVYDEYLSGAELEGIVPENVIGPDSTQMIRDYIDNWIRQKLLVHQAEKNLASAQKDFTRQMEDYRSSLIIFTYEQELVRQNLDTIVSDKEVSDYYTQNNSDFELKDNIVKVLYVKINKDKQLNNFRQLIKSDRPADRKKLIELSNKYAVNSFLDDGSWLVFDDILKEIPIKTYNQEDYLKDNHYIEIEDSLYTYLLNIKGFMIKESVSPLSFEKDNISNIIINKRKMKLVEDMKKNLYNDAIKSEDFEILIK